MSQKIREGSLRSKHNLRANSPTSIRPATILLPLAAVALMLPWITRINDPVQTFMAAYQTLICAAGIAISINSGLRPIALVYYSFTLAWLGFAPIFQLATHQVAWGDNFILGQNDIITLSLILNAFASTSFMLGSFLSNNRRIDETKTRASILHPRRTVIGIYTASATALLPLVVATNGGISGLFASRAIRQETMAEAGLTLENAGGLQVALVSILPAGLAIAACGLSILGVSKLWRTSKKRFKIYDSFILAWSSVLMVLFCNPFVNSRFLSSMAFGTIALILFRPRRQRASGIVAIIAFMGTTVFYPLADIFRHGLEEGNPLDSGLKAFASIDFDGFQQVANAILYAEEVGHSSGLYLISAAFYFIPRSLWEYKANPASIDVAENANYAFTNLSLPLHAELYIEWGIIGVIVGSLFLGYLISICDRSWSIGVSCRAALLAAPIAMSMLGLIRGPLGSLAPIYLTIILLMACGVKVVQRSDRFHDPEVESRAQE